jgi:hypothetical protein
MADYESMQIAAMCGTRLEQLHELLIRLGHAIDECAEADKGNMATLARQYRETLREIHEIEGDGDNDDAIARIASRREADGKPGAVR